MYVISKTKELRTQVIWGSQAFTKLSFFKEPTALKKKKKKEPTALIFLTKPTPPKQ